MPKGKRKNPDQKLAEELKKKIGYRNKPQTCATCTFSEDDPSSDNQSGLCCKVAEMFLVFPVDPGANCDEYKKKRKAREKKGEELADDGQEVAPEKKDKKKKKKKAKK